MNELETLEDRFFKLFFLYDTSETVEYHKDIWPKIEQLIESERAKAVAEYKAAQNVKYSPEQIGQRGPDDFNFNPLIPESIL